MDFKLIGTPCGQHGPYTFYKAFKYSKHGKTSILALSEFFFVKLWNDSDLVSIGELQLLWQDKNSEQTLASLRLYILPENTPEGRSDCHGEHEVLAITEKVVLRVEDLLTWITEAADWSWGLAAVYDKAATISPRQNLLSDNSVIDLSEIDKEKDLLGQSYWDTKSGVVVLSFPRYCRYRGILKRLEGVHNKWLRTALVAALGGFTVPCRNTRVLYCKDTFDYPDLEGHELLCNHLAPKLKGRPRKKRKLLDLSPDSSDTESESSSVSDSSSSIRGKNDSPQKLLMPYTKQMPGSLHSLVGSRRITRAPGVSTEEKEFLARLYAFMKSRQTPISRVPTIGFKELDLYKLFMKVKHLGGYDSVTTSRLWKYVYEEMGGDQTSTSAATCCRRHYERLLLPYERRIAPGRSKNSTLTKLKKLEEISITTKSASVEEKNYSVKNSQKFNINTLKSNINQDKKHLPHVLSPSFETIDLSSDVSPVKVKKVEVINLVSDSDDSPIKAKPLAASKKQKLEILREGGLEVTPISGMTNGRITPVESHRPSVIQHVSNITPQDAKEKVSITITPDVGLLMNNRHAWSLGNHSVYGNPKEVVVGSARQTSDEILDLRTKSPYSTVGSSLEITLVPPSPSGVGQQIHGKKPQQTVASPPRLKYSAKIYQPSPPTQRPASSQRPMHRSRQVHNQKTPITTGVSNGRGVNNIVPSVSISVNQKQKSKTPSATQTFTPFKTGSYPLMDPVYLSALYSGLLSPFSTASTPQQLQLYKELLHQQNIPDSFPRLLQDGSTSISLVNQHSPHTHTPTPK